MSDTPEVAMTDSERELVTERAPARKKLWAFIQDDMIVIGFRKFGEPVAYFSGDDEGIDTANTLVRLWNREFDNA